jgi:hypothetical protein
MKRRGTGLAARVIRYRFGPFELNPEEGTLSRSGMASLERAAREKGFMLVARKAAAARG